jgi:hypothetical protein
MMTEYDFDQMVAEMMERFKVERPAMEAALKKCADRFGWPIPPESRDTVMAVLVRAFNLVEKVPTKH